MLKDKVILLGVSGSIAAYKSIYLTRLLTEAGAEVLPILTKSACRFVGPLSFSALTGHRAITDLWSSAQAGEIGHVEWAHKADMLVIAPATANTIAKIALGLADDPLSAIALSTQAPILIAPAMEDGMWKNPATVAHIETLTQRGVMIAHPHGGALASGRSGMGRMMEPDALLHSISSALTPADWIGRNILVTAGPTHESLDPVRFLTNHSSGKMGYAIAQRAAARGATVHLIAGPTHLPTPPGVQLTRIQTTAELLEACESIVPECDTLIMAAAPGDYRPKTTSVQKLKKGSGDMTLELESNPDILLTLNSKREHCFTVGFAAESENLLQNAQEKLTRKDLALIVANDITAENAGFGGDTNTVTFLFANGDTQTLPTLSKLEVADRLLNEILQRSST